MIIICSCEGAVRASESGVPVCCECAANQSSFHPHKICHSHTITLSPLAVARQSLRPLPNAHRPS